MNNMAVVVSDDDETNSSNTKMKLPVREIPGDYGLPFLGPIKDRLDYFYNQGTHEFFTSRIAKYSSTVFRVNMPPGHFISSNPKVVALLDAKSFSVLFDVSQVEKKNVLFGTFMPSTKLTGGYRMLSYLDPSEPRHAELKQLVFFILKSRRDYVIPEFRKSFAALFESLENELSSKGKVGFDPPNNQALFNFLARTFLGVSPADTKLGTDGPSLYGKWVLFQVFPIISLGFPKILEEIFIHSFFLPPFLVKGSYRRLYEFFMEHSGYILEEADKMGIARDEACHNILFAMCFNAFGGLRTFFPTMLKWIGKAGTSLHCQLAQEIRSVIKSSRGEITIATMEQMPLVKSIVYESLRIEPPVPFQYGIAKRDMVVESHDATFEIKEGEMLFGYQPFATKDPRIFERSEEFVANRFVGEEGEKMLRHLLWSNGRETERTTVKNKQCGGKDMVVTASRLLVVELFSRYDTFEIESKNTATGASITFTSLKRAVDIS